MSILMSQRIENTGRRIRSGRQYPRGASATLYSSAAQITNLPNVSAPDLIWTMVLRTLLVAGVFIFTARSAHAQSGDNVLVVMNRTSAESGEIARRYTEARAIPVNNVLPLTTPVADEIDRRSFDAQIEGPISEWFTRNNAQDRILYIVLTKGIPLRVRGTGGAYGTVASVDSELTLLYRKLLGLSVAPGGRLANPYFAGDAPAERTQQFSHRTHDIYLVTRLDGFTVADAIGLIERGRAPARNGEIVLDQRAVLLGNRQGDEWLAETAKRLTAAGFGERVRLESSTAVVSGVKPVIGYASWGSNDPAIKRRRFEFGFVPGALAAMFVSTDARTLQEPPAEWSLGNWQDRRTHYSGSPQSLLGDLIREGVTGATGHVAEPYLDGTTRPHVLFPAYVAGANLAEAFYQATPFLSWQTIVVGDPLCAPFRAASLPAEDAAPALDPDTELPRFFSARRLAILSGYGVKVETAKLLLKAHARLMASDLKGAREALEAVTEIEPGLNAAHFVLGGLYERNGEYDRAIERYRTILKTRQDDVRAMNNLAYILAVVKGELQDALTLADRSYKLATDRNAILDLGYSLVTRRGTPSSALPFAEFAFNVHLVVAQIADTLGWTHHLLGNEAEAEQYLAEAVRDAPGSPEIQLHVAIFEAARGRHTEASAALERALSLDPGLAERREVKELKTRLEKR